MKTLMREFFRSLRKNTSRFLTILAIIALGVAFFAGINAAQPAMIKSAVKYYQDYNLSDLRVMNPLGFKPGQVTKLKAIEGVETLQPSITKDVFMVFGEEEKAVRLYSFDPAAHSDESLNKPEVLEGRLPKASGEIALDPDSYISTKFKLGQKVTFRAPKINEEEPEPITRNTEYTIVGLVKSPLYVSLERERTNIGDGNLLTFALVLPEDFVDKTPSEYFLRLAGTQSLDPSQSAYKEKVKALKSKVDQLGEDIMGAETADLKAELSDNRDKLAKEKTKALEELKAAKDKLDQGRQDITDGKARLEKETAEGEKKLAEGRKELQENRQKLLEGRLKYNEGLLEWQKGSAEFTAGKQAYDEKALELAQGKAELDAAKGQLDMGRAMLHQNQATMDQAKGQIETFGKIVKGLRKVRKSIPDVPTLSQEQYDEILGNIEEISPETAQSIRQFIPFETPNAPSAIRNFLDTSLDSVEASYESAKATYDEGKANYDQAQKDLDQGQADYDAGLKKYKAGKKKLDAAKEDLDKAQKKVADGKAKLDETKKKLDDGEVKIDQAEADLEEGQQLLDEKSKEGKAKLAQAEKDLAAGQKKYDEEKAKADKELAKADEELLKAERQIRDIPSAWFVNSREGNIGYSAWFDNAEKIGRVALVFPFFFFLVAALVSLTTITRLVEEERGQIGTLKALGFNRWAIATKYLTYALLAALIGSAIGLALGSQFFPRVIIGAYGMLYNFKATLVDFQPLYALISVALALLATLGAALGAITSEIRQVPAMLMQPKSPPPGQRIFLERFKGLWSRLSFSQKVTFRNLFLYKKRFWMTVLGISGCTALLLTGFGLKDSVDDIVRVQFGEIFLFDQMVHLDKKMPAAQRNVDAIMKARPEVASYDPAFMETMEAKAKGSDRTYDLEVRVPKDPQNFGKFVALRDPNSGQALDLTDDGVIITEKISNLLNLKVGDEIQYQDSDRRQFKAPVAAITESYVGHTLFLTPSLYEKVHLMKPDYQSAYVNLTAAGKADEEQVKLTFMDLESVNAVSSSQAILDNFKDQMDSLIYVVFVLIAAAGLLAFIVLYNLSNVNIAERQRELATIKVLGFRAREVDNYVFRENLVLTLFGALLGSGLGMALHKFIMKTMEFDDMMFGKNIHALSFLFAIALTFLFTFIVNFIMHFALQRINMVESLKSLE